jgi:hypothetical protein
MSTTASIVRIPCGACGLVAWAWRTRGGIVGASENCAESINKIPVFISGRADFEI